MHHAVNSQRALAVVLLMGLACLISTNALLGHSEEPPPPKIPPFKFKKVQVQR